MIFAQCSIQFQRPVGYFRYSFCFVLHLKLRPKNFPEKIYLLLSLLKVTTISYSEILQPVDGGGTKLNVVIFLKIKNIHSWILIVKWITRNDKHFWKQTSILVPCTMVDIFSQPSGGPSYVRVPVTQPDTCKAWAQHWNFTFTHLVVFLRLPQPPGLLVPLPRFSNVGASGEEQHCTPRVIQSHKSISWLLFIVFS